MKKPVAKKKLDLSTTTVRALDTQQLAQIAGGYFSSMCPTSMRNCDNTYLC